MQKIKTEEFIVLAKMHPILDVRSPTEYHHAHIPAAYNLPLFSDEERKIVGACYKNEGREAAIKIGLDYFGIKMRKMVEETEEIMHKQGRLNKQPCEENTVLVYCWRGGMRSAGVAWLLDLYGFKVYSLTGGYKSYRNWVLQQFDRPYRFNVLGGCTGSGKTELLKEMARENQPVIDLEGIARHKGSAFGALGEGKQPTQEMFENELATTLKALNPAGQSIWIEDESQRIGLLNLPDALYKTIQKSPVHLLDVPFDERLNNIITTYGAFKKEDLIAAIMRIQKRLGGLNTKNAINYLLEDNYKESFRILLTYYDKCYQKAINERSARICHADAGSLSDFQAGIFTRTYVTSPSPKERDGEGSKHNNNGRN